MPGSGPRVLVELTTPTLRGGQLFIKRIVDVLGEKQTATGSGVITALRAFGASSLTFLVTLSQKTYSTSQSGTTTAHTASADYAITIARSGSGWQVNDIQLGSAGNS